jgi:hypothetical protein
MCIARQLRRDAESLSMAIPMAMMATATIAMARKTYLWARHTDSAGAQPFLSC